MKITEGKGIIERVNHQLSYIALHKRYSNFQKNTFPLNEDLRGGDPLEISF
jgi:hypothetical protein